MAKRRVEAVISTEDDSSFFVNLDASNSNISTIDPDHIPNLTQAREKLNRILQERKKMKTVLKEYYSKDDSLICTSQETSINRVSVMLYCVMVSSEKPDMVLVEETVDNKYKWVSSILTPGMQLTECAKFAAASQCGIYKLVCQEDSVRVENFVSRDVHEIRLFIRCIIFERVDIDSYTYESQVFKWAPLSELNIPETFIALK